MRVDTFGKRYAIVILIVLTQNCAINGHVKNVANEEPSLAKVLLSYIKVPWINLNSSWTEEVTPNCRNDVAMLYESANEGEMWALQMLDSASKIPAGILTGNIWDLGMYDECVKVKAHKNPANIQGRHCMVSFSMPTKFVEDPTEMLLIQKVSIYNPTADVDFSFTTSLCVPSSCGIKDVSTLVNASIKSAQDLVAFEVNLVQVTCSGVETTDDLYIGRIVVSAFFATVVCLLLLCTVCDFVLRARSGDGSPAMKTAAKFSFYTNVIKLSSTKTGPETMPALHGIRFLNTCFVLIGHRVVGTLLKPFVNLTVAWELRQTLLSEVLFSLPYVVDTFFVLSGFLTAYLFLKALREGKKFNIFIVYLHRYLRLTPCVAVLLLFSVYYLPVVGSGPLWETIAGLSSRFCRKNWWTSILYVQNFVNPEEMCMLHTWYLAVEMQLFWACPLILYPLFYRPKLGLLLLSLVSITFLIVPAVQLAVNGWPVLFNVEKNIKTMYDEFISSYPVTYNRALPYLIGIFLGYDVANNKRQFNKFQVAFNWIICGALVLTSMGLTHFIQPNAVKYEVVWEVIYVSFLRLAWSIAMAWVLYACTHGYGGVATRFLSLPMFVPLSRMCYSIYLIHYVVQLTGNATTRIAEFNTPFGVLYLIWGDLAISIAIAFVITLCIDSPLIALEKILLAKHSVPRTKNDPTEKKRELSDIIKEYLDQTRGNTSSDLPLERTSPQVNLRRTVDQVLKTSLFNNGSTKTPAEWAKAWQDWKSYLLKSDIQRGISEEDIRNGVKKFESEIHTMEKELFIFLAGVSCGLEEAPNVESDVIRLKSQSESCSWQNEDLGRLSTMDSTPFTKKRRY